MKKELEITLRRFERERAARRQAEAILEQKALELYHANEDLRKLNEGLETEVAERTDALSTEQTRLRSLIGNLGSGVLLEDENRRIVLTNQLFCQLFGINAPPHALEGMDCSQSAEQFKTLFLDSDGFVERISELFLAREISTDEALYLADGRVFSRTFIPIFTEETYHGHLWKYEDVTDRHMAQVALRHSEEKYRGLIENMELGLMEVDNEGIILRAYPRFCEMVGYEEAELIGEIAIDIFLVPEYRETLDKQHLDREKGKASVYEMQIFNKKREKIWVLVSGAPIFGPDESVIGSLGIHYDISPQKKLQRELEEARLRAEEAEAAEKQFLANMSHEIRTPLNAIIGMSHLLYDTQPTTEQREFLDVLRNSADMLRALISDVLDLSKIRAGHFEVQEKEFDIVGLTRSLVKSAQLRFEDRPVQIDAKIDHKIKNLVIGDDLMLNQVLSNLIGNAEKFTENGLVLVSLELETASADAAKNWYEIRVSDTGIGIPADKQALIFQSFRQVDGDIKRKFGGTGLGLAIVSQLIELQGGSIRVESELGKGATFIVRLPFRKTDKKISLEDKPEFDFHHVDVRGKQVLVVEDNHMNRKYIGALLTKWGIAHAFAHNGRIGLELAKTQPFDLILMDIQMPEMDGYESTVAIRERSNPNSATPIVALTASAMLSQKDKAFRAGMNDYLSKPFKPSQLFEKILAFCGPSAIVERPKNGAADDDFHPRLDAKSLDELYGGDRTYALEMFGTFLKSILPDFDRLGQLLHAGDFPGLARLAHKLKPTLGMVGLPDLESQLQLLETGAKAEKPDPVSLHIILEKFEAELPEAVMAVEFEHEKT